MQDKKLLLLPKPLDHSFNETNLNLTLSLMNCFAFLYTMKRSSAVNYTYSQPHVFLNPVIRSFTSYFNAQCWRETYLLGSTSFQVLVAKLIDYLSGDLKHLFLTKCDFRWMSLKTSWFLTKEFGQEQQKVRSRQLIIQEMARDGSC